MLLSTKSALKKNSKVGGVWVVQTGDKTTTCERTQTCGIIHSTAAMQEQLTVQKVTIQMFW